MGFLFGGSRPKVQTQAVEDLKEEEENVKKQRRALFATEGGASGEEVSQVGQRGTLFGN